jgi:alpha-glucosidase
MEFPEDEKVFNETGEWLMGPGLLAAPILQPGGARSVYLPKDGWFNFGTNQLTQGPQTINVSGKLNEIPMYVRAGTLLPLGPVIQNTEETSTAPLELQIYPGRDASFTFVEDDGTTLGYQKGNVRTTRFSWDDKARVLSWKVEGTYRGASVFRDVKAVLFSPGGRVQQVGALEETGSVTFNGSRNFD